MCAIELDFRQSWLWQHVFVNPRMDATQDEQEFFREQYLSMRESVGHLVSLISADIPGLTVHNLSHLDSLWETASLVAEGAISLSPPEGFVFGGSILLHDSAMALAAYPGSLKEIEQTIAWKDSIARLRQINKAASQKASTPPSYTDEELHQVLPDVLRRLHAQRAEILAEQAWVNHLGEQQFLISDSDVRYFYGKTIGEIAHSHWWHTHKLEEHFSQDMGAFPKRTRNLVDPLKLACLLRIADAIHLDQLRAPRFLRTLTKPSGISALHWAFQEKIARPHVEMDSVVFTTGQPFHRDDAEAWWLAYETLEQVDIELRNVDLILRARGRGTLKARRVKGMGSPESLARSVQTRGWRPVEARIRVSDVPRIVESLGGKKLYGDDLLVPLRELIQNAADAIHARRNYEQRPSDWGTIQVFFEKRDDGEWLVVEDNGIGMSEAVLTGPLLDFGASFWRSSLILEEFPGLVASGMKSMGQFGIGFFSIFMLGQTVRVISRRCDKGRDAARLLEIKGGPGGHPILSPVESELVPVDGGTRVEVCLKNSAQSKAGILGSKQHGETVPKLSRIVAALAPTLDVAVSAIDAGDALVVVHARDWIDISDVALLSRLDFIDTAHKRASKLMRPLVADEQILGRATIAPQSRWTQGQGWITVAGLRTNRLTNVQGVFEGEILTAARNVARPLASKETVSSWATQQAFLWQATEADGETKAQVSETVLECGGEIGDLPIVRWGREWMSTQVVGIKIKDLSELIVNFEGDFNYDEDCDSMHPREFKEEFEESDEVIMVPKHDGNITDVNGVNWPGCLFEGRLGSNRLAEHFRHLIRQTWNCDYSEETGKRVVGRAAGHIVERDITIFLRCDEVHERVE